MCRHQHPPVSVSNTLTVPRSLRAESKKTITSTSFHWQCHNETNIFSVWSVEMYFGSTDPFLHSLKIEILKLLALKKNPIDFS